MAFLDNPSFLPFEAPALVKTESFFFFFLDRKMSKMLHMSPRLLKQTSLKHNLAFVEGHPSVLC